MRKEFVIGATLFAMGFVACTQPSQPTSGTAVPGTGIERTVQNAATQPTTDNYVPDIETSSKDENLDQETEKKIKTKLKKIQHTFSNGEKLRYIIAEYDQVITGIDHGITFARAEDLPKLIKEREAGFKKLKTKAVGKIYGSGAIWPNNVIPYSIEAGFTTSERAAIEQAIVWWNNSAIGVKYKPHSGQWNGVKFVSTSANTCSANVGLASWNLWAISAQHITLSPNCSFEISPGVYAIRTILHEMGHTAGLWHEQQRCDRDSFVYVTYPWWDIGNGAVNYGKICPPESLDYGMYDFSSVMHYQYGSNGADAWMYGYGNNMTSGPIGRVWSGNWTNPKTSFPSTSLRNSMSRGDIVALNVMYQNISSLATYGTWNTRTSGLIGHQIGRSDGDGWSATVGLDASVRYMNYGPYQTINTITGPTCCSAFFEVMVDNTTANNDSVAILDVNSVYGTVQTNLTSRVLKRSDFSVPYQYKQFELNFEKISLQPDTKLEFRVLWLGPSYVRTRNIFLKQ
jgi:Astacin (Peptidase family M12A)